jgi:sulfatase modifying factor 1
VRKSTRILLIVAAANFGMGGAVGWRLSEFYHRRPYAAAREVTPAWTNPVASAVARIPPPEPPEPPWTPADDALAPTLAAQRKKLLEKLRVRLRYSDEQVAAVKKIFESSRWLGQGNPEVSEHPLSRAQCRAIRKRAGLSPQWNEQCEAKNMVPIYDRARGENAADAKVCIDQFEFPNIACDYPVTWVTAREAAQLCRAVGKRLCDAHEWEGACAGSLRKPEQEYLWGKERKDMRYFHNLDREIVWAYGKTKDHSKCATGSRKSDTCTEIGWMECGSNTYPAGAFPDCVSPFGVYDLHGNAAEHMSLPMSAEELASTGGMGQTEMKGSWFIFSTYEAHIDDCRWRAPDWHATAVMDINSHRNYHLGFRCCRNIGGDPAPKPWPPPQKPQDRSTAPEERPAAEQPDAQPPAPKQPAQPPPASRQPAEPPPAPKPPQEQPPQPAQPAEH